MRGRGSVPGGTRGDHTRAQAPRARAARFKFIIIVESRRINDTFTGSEPHDTSKLSPSLPKENKESNPAQREISYMSHERAGTLV